MSRFSLTPAALLVCFAASAQTTTPPKTTTTHHTPPTTVRFAPPLPAPVVPKTIPAVTGPVKYEFALRYQDITIGAGDLAGPNMMYKVHYTGWLEDGTKFDSSVDRGQPFEFPQGMHRVIPGWDEGFEGMHVGGKRRLFIPWQLAYGEQGRGQIPPKANLIFDIELLDQRDLNAATPTPAPTPQ
ncbi:FKBP-type peptidyl-prolyl cis-trans isomerase [Alloacidobacterium dinghuense]|uniref:Peptidyl-prolyl cis-trans isomerase n=1 Tax=Alloacidobacterium dinghuense TaxID=2763107 RepID=A0A7G8BMF3_9BACT|nr:FKBP-type peptidyl-prolyl cis-trans isomerase [Alloacidobacterium dinghuense]